ncbi:MAG TPA: glucose 1-dehydrogenase [Candidatus Eisenbacteria bacterium]|nr:glucose 1-dehydrogenase [Candidatus Eisenbacteria bacterium]
MIEGLQDKIVIVTGGGHGIGRAYCLGFGRAGSRVVVADIDFPAAERVAERVGSETGAASIAVHADVADERSANAMAAAALQRFGRIDVLVNNAAIFATVPMNRGRIEEISAEEWDRLMAVNLRGVFFCVRAVLPAMRRQKSGKIINIASGTVFNGSPGRIHYVTSKAGVIGFTRTLAREVGDDNIQVNVLAPGNTLSEENPSEEMLRFRQSSIGNRALKRVQVPQDLVGAMLFLASPLSDFMTGQTLNVDGGISFI